MSRNLCVSLFYWQALVLALVVCANVIFEDCGSQYELQAVQIDGCSRHLPCYITIGESTEVVVVFTAEFSSNRLDQDVSININSVRQDTEVTPEPCNSTTCPVASSSPTRVTAKMQVPTSIALNQRGTLQWRVMNENNVLVVCYSVLVQTQSVLQKKLRRILLNQTMDIDNNTSFLYNIY